MRIFVSWSGETSLKVAEAFRDWLPCVLQSVDPYVSSEDIDKGARWSSDVASELAECNVGILCVTAVNLGAPWLNFEAGALSKSIDEGRVLPFLFDLDRTDVVGPLVQFQSTVNQREDIFRLVHTLNSATDRPLERLRLDRALELWWTSLDEELNKIRLLQTTLDQAPTSGSKEADRSPEDLLQEVLTLVRSQQKLLVNESRGVPRGDSAPARVPRAVLRDLETSMHRLQSTLSSIDDGAALDAHLLDELRGQCARLQRPVRYILREYGETGLLRSRPFSRGVPLTERPGGADEDGAA